MIKSLEENLQKGLALNIKTRIVYTRTKLLSQLKNIKDPTPFEDQYDIVHHSFFSAGNCTENYIGESARQLNQIMEDYNG